MSFGSRLRERRECLGLKQSDLGKLLGVTGSAIGNYENGVSSPKADILYQVFDVLKCDANYLFQDEMQELETDDLTVPEIRMVKKYRTLDGHGKEMVDIVLSKEAARVADERRRDAPNEGEELESNVVRIPFRCSTQSASAGTGTYLGPEAFETIYVQKNDLTQRASWGVPVSGDSMEPRYHNKDILMIEGTEEIEVGEVGIFTIDGEGYVKELGDGKLISLNSKYAPIPINDSIRCHGRVIGILEPEWIG